MMLARVADSLYWMGRYAERAEHFSRLTSVMLNAALDGGEAAAQAIRNVQAAAGEPADAVHEPALKVARRLALGADRDLQTLTAIGAGADVFAGIQPAGGHIADRSIAGI